MLFDIEVLLLFQRLIRGIPVDVWVAEKNSNPHNDFQSNDGGKEYQTTELYFSRSDWKVLVGEVNAHQSLPIGMSTFIAHSVKYTALFLLTIKQCLISRFLFKQLSLFVENKLGDKVIVF